ncbi:uncharacterized protein LOC128993573 [Macrosteles quadrilineatus]|uniref:uncharacterized protein LOC128993573 n=1 Tax=Macrosteles quadrilineatus TaxID=74068 RepID=UPI0023E0960A|nr:uncharacterized protein LOC128993573 [Macrosteles quadrilineatus]
MSDTEAVSVTRLITLVKERPVLWDRQEEVYKNRKLTRKAWAEICEALIDNYHDLGEPERIAIGRSIIGKWANLRDNWLRYWRKRQELLRVGSSTKSLKKYIHHDQLLFLSKVYDPEGQQEVEEIQVDVDVISDQEFESPVEFDETSQTSWANLQHTQFPSFSTQHDQSERHLYFFHSILPMICDFDDDQVLEFHTGVLEWVKRVKRRELSNLQDCSFINHAAQESKISTSFKCEASTQSICFCNSSHQLCKKEPKSDLSLPNTKSPSPESTSTLSLSEASRDFSASEVTQTISCDRSEFMSLKETIKNLENITNSLETKLCAKQTGSGHFETLLAQLSPKKIQSLKRKFVKEVVKEGYKNMKVESTRHINGDGTDELNPESSKNTERSDKYNNNVELSPLEEPSILRTSLQKLPLVHS